VAGTFGVVTNLTHTAALASSTVSQPDRISGERHSPEQNDYNNLASQQQQQILDAQTQIAIEISKDSLNPTTIGNLYAG